MAAAHASGTGAPLFHSSMEQAAREMQGRFTAHWPVGGTLLTAQEKARQDARARATHAREVRDFAELVHNPVPENWAELPASYWTVRAHL